MWRTVVGTVSRTSLSRTFVARSLGPRTLPSAGKSLHLGFRRQTTVLRHTRGSKQARPFGQQSNGWRWGLAGVVGAGVGSALIAAGPPSDLWPTDQLDWDAHSARSAVGALVGAHTVICFTGMFLLSTRFRNIAAWLVNNIHMVSIENVRAGRISPLLLGFNLHLDIPHLLMNSVGIMLFGPLVVEVLGDQWFFVLFALAGIAGGFGSLLRQHFTANKMGALGSSGALGGLISFGLLTRYDENMSIANVDIPAMMLLPLFVALDLRGLVRGKQNVDHASHLAGMLSGGLFYLATKDSFGTSNDALRGRQGGMYRGAISAFQPEGEGRLIAHSSRGILDTLTGPYRQPFRCPDTIAYAPGSEPFPGMECFHGGFRKGLYHGPGILRRGPCLYSGSFFDGKMHGPFLRLRVDPTSPASKTVLEHVSFAMGVEHAVRGATQPEVAAFLSTLSSSSSGSSGSPALPLVAAWCWPCPPLQPTLAQVC